MASDHATARPLVAVPTEPPGPTGADDQLDDLVTRAVAGDRAALGAVLAAIRPVVVRSCRARLGRGGPGAADADDVAQEVCLAVLRALPGYRDQGRPFLAFVHGIAAHKIVDARRAAVRRPVPVAEPGDRPDLDDGPETLAVRRAGEPGLRRTLAALPRRQREILHLRVVVGLSAEETARAVGSTAGAVRVAQHRALSALRRAFPAGAEREGPTGDPELDALFADADHALADLAES